jgi:hypothetical protein
MSPQETSVRIGGLCRLRVYTASVGLWPIATVCSAGWQGSYREYTGPTLAASQLTIEVANRTR